MHAAFLRTPSHRIQFARSECAELMRLSSDIIDDMDIMQIHPLAALFPCAALTCARALAPNSTGDRPCGVTDTPDALGSRERPLT